MGIADEENPPVERDPVELEKIELQKIELQTIELQTKILLSTIYRTLDENAQNYVIAQVQSQLQSKNYDNLSNKFNIKASYENRYALTAACERCDVKLASSEFQLANFHFLEIDKKQLIAQDLYYAYFIYCAQYALDQAEGRTVNYNSVAAQLDKCVLLLSALRNVSLSNTSDSLSKYLVAASIPILNTCLSNITAGNTMTMLSDFNILRFFWIWSSAAIDSVLALLNRSDSRELLSWPSPVSGHISYSLYALRGGFELAKGVKHVVLPTNAEKEIDWWTRLKQQASQRKFRLINDGIWGPANAACFYWLVNSLSAYNAGLTVLLLLMDSAVAYWDYAEQKARYDVIIGRIGEEVQTCNTNSSDNDTGVLAELNKELAVLAKKKSQALELLQYTACYAILLTLGCAILVSPGGLPCLVVGSFVCMVLSLFYEGLSSTKKIKYAEADCVQTQQLLAELKATFLDTEGNTPKSKLIFNQIQYLEATTVDQQAQISYQRFNLQRTMLTKALVPPFILICLLLLPFGWPAVGGMIAVVILALAVNLMINQIYPPPAPTTGMKYNVEALLQGQNVPAFNSEEYPRKIYVKSQGDVQNIYFYNDEGELISHELDNIISTNILKLSVEGNQPLSDNIKQIIFETAVRNGYDFYFDDSAYKSYLEPHRIHVDNGAAESKEQCKG